MLLLVQTWEKLKATTDTEASIFIVPTISGQSDEMVQAF